MLKQLSLIPQEGIVTMSFSRNILSVDTFKDYFISEILTIIEIMTRSKRTRGINFESSLFFKLIIIAGDSFNNKYIILYSMLHVQIIYRI